MIEVAIPSAYDRAVDAVYSYYVKDAETRKGGHLSRRDFVDLLRMDLGRSMKLLVQEVEKAIEADRACRSIYEIVRTEQALKERE
jgi:hypothetical protein